MDFLQSDDDTSGEEVEVENHNEETERDASLKSKPETPNNEDKADPIKVHAENDRRTRNIRALPKSAETYELEKFEKKLLVIFNHVNVFGCEPRVGTEKDVYALRNTFENLGFTVEEKPDFTKAEIMSQLNTYVTKDFTDYGCVAIAVLTHGAAGGKLRARDEFYSENDILFNLQTDRNTTLITKPKILIIQACRGDEDITGVSTGAVSKVVFKDSAGSEKIYTLPKEADILCVHSSYIGMASHRTSDGSWFIQALCRKIDELAHKMDIEAILVEMKRVVAIDHAVDYCDANDEVVEDKQMPVVTSTLIRQLYLKNYQPQDDTENL